MAIINQGHDKLFKETFSNIKIAKDFMDTYLPQNVLDIVNLETLEPQKDSFINKELEEVFADLLFKVDINSREGYIYFLFEHKSYKDKLAIFQLLRYMIEIWERKIEKEKIYELPIIIPLLIYHDRGKWDIKTNLGEMISGYDTFPEEIKRYIPNYEYLVYDLTQYKDEDIKGEAITRIALKMMRDARYAEKNQVINILEDGFRLLSEVIEKDTVTYYMESCLRYIFSVRNDIDKDEMIKIAGMISVEGSALVMTAADKLIEEGMQKGLEEGLEKGLEKGMEKVAKNAIIKGMDIQDIIELTGLTKKEIDQIRKEMLN